VPNDSSTLRELLRHAQAEAQHALFETVPSETERLRGVRDVAL